MAIFIPYNESKNDFHGSIGEYELHKLFKKLPDDYYIFHSVEWIKSLDENNKTWGESDYVIFHPKRGILVIEVKGGNIKSKNGIFYQQNTKTKLTKVIVDPMKQASRSKYKFLDSFGRDNNFYKIDVAVWFTGVSSFDKLYNLPLTYEKGNVLTKEDYEDVEESLNRVFNYYNMPLSNKFNDIDKKKVLQILAPEFNAISTLNDRLEEEQFIFKKMTQEQFKILDYLEDEKYASIKGGAGTGKTVLALEKSRRLSQNGDKVLFLAYNKFLIEILKENYKEIYPNVSFCSLFFLAFELKNGLLDEGEKVLDVLKKYKENWKYKHVVIDEGQDFGSDELKIIYEITREVGGEFYLFYDCNQVVNLKYRENNWINPVEGASLKLKINCRNTKNIAEISYSSIDNIDNVEIVMKNNVQGEKIEYTVYKDREDFFNKIYKILINYEKEKIENKRIVLISLKSEENTILKQIKKIGSFNLVKTITNDPTKILKTTARKYKGLESDIVILFDLDEESINDPDIEKLFYVTCSRAKHILHILSKIEIEDLYFFNDNIDILKKIVINKKNI